MLPNQAPPPPIASAFTGRWLLGACLLLVACDGDSVSLGDLRPRSLRFGPAVPVPELAAAGHRDNPTLTADLLEIFFTSNEDSQSNGDVWSARRASKSEPFASAAPIADLTGTDRETSSAISADGLTLWFGSDRAGGSGGLDIWVTARASRTAPWSAPMNLTALNSSADDIPRPPGQGQLVMPLSTTKQSPSNLAARNYQTYLATRADRASPFQAPATITEIDAPNLSVVDGCLSDDGLMLLFSSTGVASSADAGASPLGGTMDADIFIAYRRALDAPFTFIEAPADLHTSANERDPWLSPDGSVVYFTSDRDGETAIYTAPVLRP